MGVHLGQISVHVCQHHCRHHLGRMNYYYRHGLDQFVDQL